MVNSNVKKPSVKFCSSCLYSTSSAVGLDFDEKNVCTGCMISGEKSVINWVERKKYFIDLLEGYRGKFNKQYDCIIPVSGGKDSFFQAHLIKELGYNALLVTYNGNNYSKTGLENVQIMREVFGFDHIFFYTSSKNFKKT